MIPPSGLEAAAPPTDLADGALPREEGDPDDDDEPSSPHIWRAAMGEWEAKMTALAKEFERFMLTIREAPT
ncbi:unnamed protein product [Lampetra fluviatilis]